MKELSKDKILDKRVIIFSELYIFIKLLPDELKNKISKNFLNKVNNNSNKEYCMQIEKDVYNLKLSKETQIIIGMMYRDYFCSKEEREKLYQNEKKQLLANKKEIEKKYNVDNLFKNKKIKNKSLDKKIEQNNQINNLQADSSNEGKMLVFQDKWYKKIFDKIRNLFGRK